MKIVARTLAFLLLSLVARAQAPDPAAILAESTRRIGEIRFLTCDARYVVNHPGGSNEEHRLLMAVSRNDDSIFGRRFRISDTTFNTVLAWDGARGIVIEDNQRKITIDTNGRGALLGTGILGRLTNDFPIGRKPYNTFTENGAIISHAGTATIDGEECDQIRLDFAEGDLYNGYIMRFWIARSDRFPRKFVAEPTDARTGLTIEWSAIRSIDAPPADRTAIVAELAIVSQPEPSNYARNFYQAPTVPTLLPLGSVAPDWRLPTPNGDTVSLASLRGRVVVLDFWATWCGPCRQAMPHIQQLHEKFAGRGVAVFGVHCYEREGGDPAGMMKEMKLDYGLLLNGSFVARDYKVFNIPSLYVIAPDGTIAFTDIGFSRKKIREAEEVIERMLGNRE